MLECPRRIRTGNQVSQAQVMEIVLQSTAKIINGLIWTVRASFSLYAKKVRCATITTCTFLDARRWRKRSNIFFTFENEKGREQGTNLRRQRLASPTAQVLYWSLTLRLHLHFPAVRSTAILFFVLCWFVLAASSAFFFPFCLPPPNPPIDRVSPNVALKTRPWRSRFFWTGRLVSATNTWAVRLAGCCRCRFDPRSRSFSFFLNKKLSWCSYSLRQDPPWGYFSHLWS